MVLLLVFMQLFMQLTRDLFAIAKFLFIKNIKIRQIHSAFVFFCFSFLLRVWRKCNKLVGMGGGSLGSMKVLMYHFDAANRLTTSIQFRVLLLQLG